MFHNFVYLYIIRTKLHTKNKNDMTTSKTVTVNGKSQKVQFSKYVARPAVETENKRWSLIRENFYTFVIDGVEYPGIVCIATHDRNGRQPSKSLNYKGVRFQSEKKLIEHLLS